MPQTMTHTDDQPITHSEKRDVIIINLYQLGKLGSWADTRAHGQTRCIQHVHGYKYSHMIDVYWTAKSRVWWRVGARADHLSGCQRRDHSFATLLGWSCAELHEKCRSCSLKIAKLGQGISLGWISCFAFALFSNSVFVWSKKYQIR